MDEDLVAEIKQRARDEYHACETHGEITAWIERALVAEAALKEIDEILMGTLPVTAEVKRIAQDALKSAGRE